MAKGNKKVNGDDEPSYDELMDILEELNEYLGKEKSTFNVLKKEYVSLKNNYKAYTYLGGRDSHTTPRRIGVGRDPKPSARNS